MTQHTKKLLEQHEVGTVVVSCMDFRFRRRLLDAMMKDLGVDECDEIKLAGGAKNIASPNKSGRFESVLDDLMLAVKKHGARRIVLLTHQNCGKYVEANYVFTDPDTERIFHERELRLAGDILFRHLAGDHTDVEIILGYMWVDKDDMVRIDRVRQSSGG